MTTTIAILIQLFFACCLAAFLWWELRSKEKTTSLLRNLLVELQRLRKEREELYTELEEAKASVSLLDSIKTVARQKGATGSELEVCQFIVDSLKNLAIYEAHHEGRDVAPDAELEAAQVEVNSEWCSDHDIAVEEIRESNRAYEEWCADYASTRTETEIDPDLEPVEFKTPVPFEQWYWASAPELDCEAHFKGLEGDAFEAYLQEEYAKYVAYFKAKHK